MMKSLRLSTLLPVVLVAFLAACSGSETKAPESPAASSPAASSPAASPAASPASSPAASASKGEKYPDQIIKNFMGACDPKKENTKICQCSIDKIQERYSLEEFIKIDKEVGQGKELPKGMLDILEECKKEA